MLTSPFTELVGYLASRYPVLGRPLELTPLTFEFPVSNSLFQYETSEGRFLVKAMAHPRALYGHLDVVDRLELVGRAALELRDAGLPVEEIIPGHEGRFVQQYKGHLLRLYAFDPGRAFADPDKDCRRAARALRRLHAKGLWCLGDATRKGLARFKKPYSLRTTASELPSLRSFLEKQADSLPAYGDILEQWDAIEWAVERTRACRPLLSDPPCLVHTDFHPRNALFGDERDEATIIDLDSMIIDRRLTCLGFAILRFAFFQRERSQAALRSAIAIFAAEDRSNSAFIDDLVDSMIQLELEKTLRILYRVKTTGHYTGFIANICPLHLANIRMLRTGLSCE